MESNVTFINGHAAARAAYASIDQIVALIVTTEVAVGDLEHELAWAFDSLQGDHATTNEPYDVHEMHMRRIRALLGRD